MKYELLQMREQGSGAIVNCSSLGGLVGIAGRGVYHASKHGVPALQNGDMDEQDRREVKKFIEAFAEIAIETHRIFGLEMPEMELVRKKLDAGRQPSGNENLSVIQSGHQDTSSTPTSPFQPPCSPF